MSDVTEAQAAQVAPEPQPAQPTQDTPQPAQPSQPAQPATNDFSLPDAYKEKSWAAKVKSQEDVYKLVDNLNQLVGKKQVPFDYEHATPEEITAYHTSIAPKDLSAYEFPNADDPVAKAIGEAFRSSGLSGVQGKAVVQSLAPMIQKMEEDRVAGLKDAGKYTEISKKEFGDGYEAVLAKVNKAIVESVPKELGAAFDDMPNEHRHAVNVAINKIVSGYEAKFAEVVKQYGIKESGAQGGVNPSSAATDKVSLQKSIRAELRAMDGRPHTAQEKQALITRLNETYK